MQSRPITTLYPIPSAGTDSGALQVYLSVGHQQMMTAAMKPLGLTVWQQLAVRPMYAAGGRLFVNVTSELSSPTRRQHLLKGIGGADPLIHDALTTLLARDPFPESAASAIVATPPPMSFAPPPALPDTSEAEQAWVANLIQLSETTLVEVQQQLESRSGLDAVDFILEDITRLKQSISDPNSFAALLGGMNAAHWLNEHLLTWLGEKSAADILSQSAPHNVTAELGLALLDVADVLRSSPEVIAYLQQAPDEGFLEGLLPLTGGLEASPALRLYLARYGMRCVGEIDMTRPRWQEAPSLLVPLLLSNLKNFEPGAGRHRFEQGQLNASQKEQELLERLRELPDGEAKAAQTQRMIQRLRNLIGYREYPKYHIVRRCFLYNQALLREAQQLVDVGVLTHAHDIYYLTLQELHELVRTHTLDPRLLHTRRAEHAQYEQLSPRRVLTSEGEVIRGTYRRAGLPAGALVGLAVSAGVVEGRARVLSNMADAELEVGDILMTPFTDPSWTPAFVAIRGLVTEVGGLMTHGAVIAREYGLPAVVGVENATRLIQDRQRIRVHGTEGFVELL